MREVSGLPVYVRLELLAGHLADQLITAKEINRFVLAKNASVMTRGSLEMLSGMVGQLWEHLRDIHDETALLRKAYEAAEASPFHHRTKVN